jgi:hypothetical protein
MTSTSAFGAPYEPYEAVVAGYWLPYEAVVVAGYAEYESRLPYGTALITWLTARRVKIAIFILR